VTAAVVTHDDLGRFDLAFMDGEPASGLPRGAAMEGFRRRYGLSEGAAADLRSVLAIVERSSVVLSEVPR
jgi:hypothetical protein